MTIQCWKNSASTCRVASARRAEWTLAHLRPTPGPQTRDEGIPGVEMPGPQTPDAAMPAPRTLVDAMRAARTREELIAGLQTAGMAAMEAAGVLWAPPQARRQAYSWASPR